VSAATACWNATTAESARPCLKAASPSRYALSAGSDEVVTAAIRVTRAAGPPLAAASSRAASWSTSENTCAPSPATVPAAWAAPWCDRS
jgi:hypothetical protein